MDDIIYSYEYPLVHSNSFGISEVSKLARKHGVKVLLGGEGADELFGGYWFQIKYNFIIKFQNKVTNQIAVFLKKIIHIFDNESLIKSCDSSFYSEVKNTMEKKNATVSSHYNFIRNPKEREINVFMLNILDEYLQPILLRADKMGMKNSVELRSPFMDLDIIEFALNLPPKHKFNFLNGKCILKKVAERYLPYEIVYREKVGFPMPFSRKFEINSSETPSRNYILYSKNILKKMFA